MRSCGLKDATILEAEAKAQGAIGPVFFMWEFPKIRGYPRVPLKGYYKGTIRVPLKGSISV